MTRDLTDKEAGYFTDLIDNWPEELVIKLGSLIEKLEIDHARSKLSNNPIVVVMAIIHSLVIEAKRCGLDHDLILQAIDCHPYWQTTGIPMGWGYDIEFVKNNTKPLFSIEVDESGDNIILSDQVKQKMTEDPELREVMSKAIEDMRNSIQAVKDGRYKTIDEAMAALGHEMEKIEEENDDDTPKGN